MHLFFIFLLFISCTNEQVPETKSILKFAYNNKNQSIVKSQLDLKTIAKGEYKKSLIKYASEHQPLYINFKFYPDLAKRFPLLKDKKVLFHHQDHKNGIDSHFQAYDIEKKVVLWKSVINNPILNKGSTGIINLINGKIYFLTENHTPEKLLLKSLIPKERIPTDTQMYSRYTSLNSINLDGTNHKSFHIDLDQISKTTLKNPYKAHMSKYIQQCRTALAGEFTKEDSYIVLGCSGGHEYGVFKNVRGVILKYIVDDNGEIFSDKRMVFSPAKNTNDPMSGKDIGIYLGGASLAINDDKIYVTTSNGMVNAKQENYGCSILSLNKSNLKLDKFISTFPDKTTECYYFNADTSSSSLVLSENYAFNTSKDGYLRVFNHKTMNKDTYSETKIGAYLYGNPTVFKKDNTYIVLNSGNNKSLLTQYFNSNIIGTIEHEKNYKKYGYTKKECLGYIPKDKVNTESINLYYAGKLRKNLIHVPKGHPLNDILTSPYNTKLSDEYKIFQGAKYFPIYSKIETDLSLPINAYDNSSFDLISIEMGIDQDYLHNNVLKVELKKSKIFNAKINYLKAKKENCKKDFENFQKIYRYDHSSLNNPKPLKATIEKFAATSDYKLKHINTHQLPSGFEVDRTQISGFISAKKEKFIVYAMSGFNPKEKRTQAKLVVQNLKEMKVVKEFDLEASTHFGHILIIDKTIVVPTIKGIELFKFI